MRSRKFQIRSIIYAGCALLLCGTVSAPQATEAASVPIRIGNMVIEKDVRSVQDLKYDKVVRQTTDFSCGAASLATILTYYFGMETTEQQILTTVLQGSEEAVQRIKEKGISLLDLKEYGESVGYEGKGFRLGVNQLQHLDRPAIVLINADGFNHFVVMKQIVDNHVYVADPVKGNLVLELNEFEKIWNGIVLAFRKTDGEKVETHALYAKQVLPEEKNRLFPKLNDLSTIVSTPADF